MKLISITASDYNLNCRGTIPPPLALSLAVQLSTPTFTFYRTAGTPDVYLHKWFLQLWWKGTLWMCWQCQINQLLFCEVVDTFLNSQALHWTKPKCFFPPRWTQLQFGRCFILRTNHSLARTMPGLVSSALHSPLCYPDRLCTFKHTICSDAISFVPLAACCVHTTLRWQIARQPSCYFRYLNWNNLKKIKQLCLTVTKTLHEGLGRDCKPLYCQSNREGGYSLHGLGPRDD